MSDDSKGILTAGNIYSHMWPALTFPTFQCLYFISRNNMCSKGYIINIDTPTSLVKMYKNKYEVTNYMSSLLI